MDLSKSTQTVTTRRRTAWWRFAALGLAAVVLAGIGFLVAIEHLPFKLYAVRSVGVVATRPPGTIGLEATKGPWQVFEIDMKASDARRQRRWGMTFHLTISDCEPVREQNGLDLTIIEDVYADGVSLNRYATKAEIQRSKATRAGHLIGEAYANVSDIKTYRSLCFQGEGGNMAGATFKSNIVRVAGPGA